MTEDKTNNVWVDLLRIINAPPDKTKIAEALYGKKGEETKKEEAEPRSLGELFREDCVAAGYNVFQLVDCQISKAEDGSFKTAGHGVYGAGADSFRPVDNFIKGNITLAEKRGA